MSDKYLEYTLEELMDDPNFMNWTLHGTNSMEWETLLSHHPEFTDKVKEAKEIIFLLREIQEENLVEEDKLNM